jgi:hypothetical protein
MGEEQIITAKDKNFFGIEHRVALTNNLVTSIGALFDASNILTKLREKGETRITLSGGRISTAERMEEIGSVAYLNIKSELTRQGKPTNMYFVARVVEQVGAKQGWKLE